MTETIIAILMGLVMVGATLVVFVITIRAILFVSSTGSDNHPQCKCGVCAARGKK